MARALKQDLPSSEEIWERVRSFAQKAMETKTPIYTNQKGVRNFVTEVSPGSIGRRSDEGPSNTSRVGRTMVMGVWDSLLAGGSARVPGVLYFTYALMLAALSDLVELDRDGELVLRVHPDIGKFSDVVGDIGEILERESLTKTERERLVAARLGQGAFRQDLISYWHGCSVTACKDLLMVRASHIKPWSMCEDSERLDQYNGLLLVPNLDVAFDQGLITFDESGLITISRHLDRQDAHTLGISDGMRVNPIPGLTKRHQVFMRYHRERLFKS